VLAAAWPGPVAAADGFGAVPIDVGGATLGLADRGGGYDRDASLATGAADVAAALHPLLTALLLVGVRVLWRTTFCCCCRFPLETRTVFAAFLVRSLFCLLAHVAFCTLPLLPT